MTMKSIAVYSTSGGAGKSAIAANLASALFYHGTTVILCELSPSCLLPIHFGGDLKDRNHALENEADQKICRHSLHKDFTLFTPNTFITSTSNELLTAAMYQANKLHAVNGVMILDIPTNLQLQQESPLFDIGLEIVSADPVSVAAVFNKKLFTKARDSKNKVAHNDYIVINKQDFRSDLSKDSAVAIEHFFSSRLLGNIHYDSAVPEAFSHKSLVSEYAPHGQATKDIGELASTVKDLIRSQANGVKGLA